VAAGASDNQLLEPCAAGFVATLPDRDYDARMTKLFVAMPFGRRPVHGEPFNFDSLYESVIVPACKAAGWDWLRADEIVVPGLITEQVLREIIAADLLLAEISTHNPNVYYELGIRQSLSTGGSLILAQLGTELPFDVANQRVLFYGDTAEELTTLAETLTAALQDYATTPTATPQSPLRRLLEEEALVASPAIDAAAFESDFNARLARAKTIEQLYGLWAWARPQSPLPLGPVLALAQQFAERAELTIATEVLQVAVKSHPRDYEVHRQLGWCLRQLGPSHFPEAIRHFELALSINASDPETLGMLGGLHKRRGDYATAAAYYGRAARIAPSSWNSAANQAALDILATPDAPEAGIRRYRDLITQLGRASEPSNEWTEIMLAEAHFALGADEQAERHYDRAVSLSPSLSVVEAAASQLELFLAAGFRPSSAEHLLGSLKEHLARQRKRVSARTPATHQRQELPVLIHISDLHFDRRGPSGKHRFDSDPSETTLADQLVCDLRSPAWSFDRRHLHLVVSGDLTWHGLDEEFSQAQRCLEQLADELDIARRRIHIVPGNHDVNWSIGAADNKRRFDNYVRFLARFYGDDLMRERYPSVGFRMTDPPPAPQNLCCVVRDDESQVVVACVNSCVYENEAHHYGYVGEPQLKALRDGVVTLRGADGLLGVAVVHHHIHPYPEYLVRPAHDGEVWHDVSTIRDSAIVEQVLEKLEFALVLHGHKHRAQSRDTLLRDARVLGDPRPLIVCGAGSASCLELEHSVPNQYQVIEVRRLPRRTGVEFARLTWRTLDVAPGAEWVTAKSWDIPG
jgi:tetratricopeptide (TPR) repeat protein